MKNAVISYPRIGALRELKFTLEKYFKNELSQEESLKQLASLKKDTGKVKRKRALILSRVMTFLFMIMC